MRGKKKHKRFPRSGYWWVRDPKYKVHFIAEFTDSGGFLLWPNVGAPVRRGMIIGGEVKVSEGE